MSLFTLSLKSNRNSITAHPVRSRLEAQGFNVKNKETIRQEINRLNKEAMDLIGDNDAYYDNLKACWDLTSLLLGEVK